MPGIVAAINGARCVRSGDASSCCFLFIIFQVVLTDYPDQALVDNIIHNVNINVQEPSRRGVYVKVCGYRRGSDPGC